MKRIDLTKTGGFPLEQETLAFMQTTYSEVINAIATMFGSKVIVDGVVTTGSNVSAGWIIYNGELIKFDACTLDNKVAIAETGTAIQFEDGLSKTVFFEKRAICGAVGVFNFSEFIRMKPFTEVEKKQLDRVWLTGDVKQIFCDADYITSNFDSSGLGKSERVGWAICNGNNGTENMGGRVLIGMQYPAININPNDNVWDAIYNTCKSIGGEKSHQLTIGELAKFNIKIGKPTKNDLTSGNSGNAINDINLGGLDQYSPYVGNDEAHENRQPFKVALFIQKL